MIRKRKYENEKYNAFAYCQSNLLPDELHSNYNYYVCSATLTLEWIKGLFHPLRYT